MQKKIQKHISLLCCSLSLAMVCSSQILKAPVKKTEEKPVTVPVKKNTEPVKKKEEQKSAPVVIQPAGLGSQSADILKQNLVQAINRLLAKTKGANIIINDDLSYDHIVDDVRMEFNSATGKYAVIITRRFIPKADKNGWVSGVREIQQTNFNFENVLQISEADDINDNSNVKALRLILSSNSASYSYADKFNALEPKEEKASFATDVIKVYYPAAEKEDRIRLVNAFMRLKELEK